MNPKHEVISDFLDGEAFDPLALGEALADPAGRDLLIDFVVLRYAAQSDDVVAATPLPVRRPSNRLYLAAAAAVLVALVGGYQFGQRQTPLDSPQAPQPSRVVQVEWQKVSEESVR